MLKIGKLLVLVYLNLFCFKVISCFYVEWFFINLINLYVIYVIIGIMVLENSIWDVNNLF